MESTKGKAFGGKDTCYKDFRKREDYNKRKRDDRGDLERRDDRGDKR